MLILLMLACDSLPPEVPVAGSPPVKDSRSGVLAKLLSYGFNYWSGFEFVDLYTARSVPAFRPICTIFVNLLF